MKFITKLTVIVLLFSLLIQPASVFAAEEEWTYYNSIIVTIKPEKITEGKKYTPDDFPEIDASKVLVFSKGDNHLDLIIVLNQSGNEALASAIEAVSQNELVWNVSKNNYLPFESSATLNKDSATIKVGEKITLGCKSSDISGMPGFREDEIEIRLIDDVYDDSKEYTPDDFPEYDIIKVEQNKELDNQLVLTLKKSEYFNLCNTIDALANDPKIKSVSYVVLPTGARHVYNWSVADSSIVKFDSDINDDDILFGYKDVTLTALKEGKTTVTLELGYNDGDKAYATCELTVIDDSTLNSDSENTSDSNTDSNTPNPQTGGTTAHYWLIALAAVFFVAVVISARYKRERK